MSIVTRVKRLVGTTRRPDRSAMADPGLYLGAAIPNHSLIAAASERDADVVALMRRVVHWAYIAGQMNATNAASVRMRLYAPATEGGVTFNVRGVGKHRTKSLKNPQIVGRKAAVYADRSETVVEVEDHPALRLLDRPNTVTDTYGDDFLQATYAYMEAVGVAYWHVTRTPDRRNQPNGLYLMPPQWTRLVPDRANFISHYEFGAHGASVVPLKREEVIRLRFAQSLTDPFGSWCPLRAVVQDVDLISTALASEVARWANQSRPDWYAVLDDTTPNSRVKEIRTELQRALTGIRNHGRFWIGKGVKDLKSVGFAPKEMEYLSGQDVSKTRILAAYGIPESLVELNDANLASSQTAHVSYMRLTIRHRVLRMVEQLNEHLLPMFPDARNLWFAPDDVVPEDEEKVQQSMVSMAGGPVITVNEARTMLGHEPIDGGDELRGQQPQQSEGPSLFRLSAGQKSLPGKRDMADEEFRIGLLRRLAEAVGAWLGTATVSADVGARSVFVSLPPATEPVVQALTEAFEVGTREAVEALARIGRETTGQAVTTARERAVARVAEQAAEVRSVAERSIQDEVGRILEDGIEDGRTPQEISRDIQEAMGPEARRFQAERIARTEASHSWTQSHREAWRAEGVERVRWLLAPDACPVCEAVAAQVPDVPVGEPFVALGAPIPGTDRVADFRPIMGGDAHPNCRCAIVPV